MSSPTVGAAGVLHGSADICIVAAINDKGVLESNLLRSPCVRAGIPVRSMSGYSSASKAYNAALESCDAAVIVFAHQDVYLPGAWLAKLRNAIRDVEKTDPNWGVLGVFGIKADRTPVGRVWSSGVRMEIFPPEEMPAPVVSVDELLIVLRGKAGIKFDDGLPGFHLYGTDIVQTALAAGHGAYVVDMPVIHNSVPVKTLLGPYLKAFRYVARKWRRRLPIPTPCSTVTWSGFGLLRGELLRIARRMLALVDAPATKRLDSVTLAKQLGYE